MFGATKVGNQRSSPYATTTDFCQIFETDMNRLYRLSFLLTGDEPTAEQCFRARRLLQREFGLSNGSEERRNFATSL
jgi:hypothetical protein